MLLISKRMRNARPVSFDPPSVSYVVRVFFPFFHIIIVNDMPSPFFIIILTCLYSLLFTFWGVFACNFVNYETDRANDMTAIGLFWKSVPYLSYTMEEGGDENVFVIGACSPFNWFGETLIQYDGPFKAARGFGLVSVNLSGTAASLNIIYIHLMVT